MLYVKSLNVNVYIYSSLNLPHNRTHLTCQQSNAENSPSQASTVFEQELPHVQPGVRKGKGTIDQIANIHWIIEKAREFEKTIYFCFIDYTKAFDCVDRNKLWKVLKEMVIPDHLPCLLTNLYGGQEATEQSMEQQTSSKFGKEYIKAVYCLPAYLTYMQSTSC